MKPCYLEQDNGLASLKNMEGGGNCANSFVYRSMTTMGYATTTTTTTTTTTSYCSSSSYVSNNSPRSGTRYQFCYDARFEDHQPHFLQACSLCNKPLSDNRDIFMYRGDTPFCSEECREEQIEIDEAKEKNKNMSSSMKALRNKKDQRKSTSSPNKAQDYSFRTGAVAAA